MPLTITNNYFEDLALAVDANLFARNGKNPKKADLYTAIDAHNAQCLKTPEVAIEVEAPEVTIEVEAVAIEVEAPEVTIEVEAVTIEVEAPAVTPIFESTEAYDILRSQWNDRKIGKGKQITQKNFKKEMFETARVLSESLLTNGLKDTVAQFEKSETYVRRSARAYTQIYQKSEVIQNLFDSGKISWSAIHKLAEQNPDKVGIFAIEKQATEIAGSGLLKTE